MKHMSFAVMLAVLSALSQPAWAQGNGGGNGNGNGQGGENGQGQSENAGRGNNGENDNGLAHGNAGGQGQGKADPPPFSGELSEDDALAAVNAGRAVELSAILPDVRARTGGEVINAQLQQVGTFLIYAVTVLTPSGQVFTEHYYARSGVHIDR